MDRNELVRRAYNQGVKMAAGHNGSDLLVPGRLAKGPGNCTVAVAVISGDHVPVNFAMALAAMEYMVGRLGLGFVLLSNKGDVPAMNRNTAAQQAVEFKADWLLLLDGHTTFPPNALPKLINLVYEHRLDIVGPTIAARTFPHRNLAVPKGGETQTVTGSSLVEVDALPASFLLIRLSALEALKRPYFRYPVVEEAEGVLPGLTDDVQAFCAAATAAGLKVWLDVELSTQMVSWGECGYRLTGSDDPEKQYDRVEVGMPQPAQAEAANEQAPKIEVPA